MADEEVKDTEDTSEVEDVKEENETTDANEEGEWTPPSRDEYEKLLARHRAATAEAALRRKLLKEAGINPNTGKRREPEVVPETTKDDQAPNPISDVKLRKEQARATEAEARASRAMTAAVRSALQASGVTAKSSRLLLPMIDLEDIDLDAHGDITGLEDRIDELKEEYPELFSKPEEVKPRRPARSAGGVDRKDKVPAKDSFGMKLLRSAGISNS